MSWDYFIIKYQYSFLAVFVFLWTSEMASVAEETPFQFKVHVVKNDQNPRYVLALFIFLKDTWEKPYSGERYRRGHCSTIFIC